jgi:hypothetical protein
MEDVFASDEAPSQLTDATTEAEDLVTPWPAPVPQAPEPRRSSRLVNSDSGNYVSVVDRAVLRKKVRMEGAGISVQEHHGVLPAEDLIAVAVEDGAPLPGRDLGVIAVACDISLRELLASESGSLEDQSSP